MALSRFAYFNRSPRFGSRAVAAAALGALSALTCIAIPRTAYAQVVVGYNNVALYNAAASTVATYGFEGIAPSGSSTLNPTSQISPLTVTVSGGSGGSTNFFVVDGANFNGDYSLNGSADLIGTVTNASAANTTTISFGNSITAFGTDFGFRIGGLSPAPTGAASVQLFNGTTAVGTAFVSVVPVSGTFVGLTSTQVFDRATFTTTATTNTAYQAFDNVRVGSRIAASATPEPGTLSLLATGLAGGAGMIGTVKRRKAKQSA